MVRRGFSLVEVMVSVVLLSLGVLGAASAGELALRLSSRAALEERATLAAATLLDSLLSEAAPVAGEAVAGELKVRWTVAGGSGSASLLELAVTLEGGGEWVFAALHAPLPHRPGAVP